MMAISGLASVALLSLELMIASEALSQLNEKYLQILQQ